MQCLLEISSGQSAATKITIRRVYSMKLILPSILLVAAAFPVWAEEAKTTEASLSMPAVSSVNGKVEYSGGWMESEEGHNFAGSITLPVGERFGIQADGLYTRVSGRDFFGGAGHFFWRDPNIGLVGLSGGGVQTDGVLHSYQGLMEAEYYFSRVTVGVLAGVGRISYDDPAPFIDTNPTKFVSTFSLNWYACDNLRLGASYSYLFDNQLGQVEAEYQTPWRGLCLTAEYARGENSYDHALLGVRFYFGKDKSLKARQRQDDPPSLARHILTGVGLYGAESNRKWREFDKMVTSAGSDYGVYGAILTMGSIEYNRPFVTWDPNGLPIGSVFDLNFAIYDNFAVMPIEPSAP